MFGYINTGRVSIRIHRDITGEMWFGVARYDIGNYVLDIHNLMLYRNEAI